MPNYDLAFFVALGLIFGSALIGFAWHLHQESLDRQNRRYLARVRWHYDNQGNPEYFYDPFTQEHFLPPPGNNPSAPTENIIFHPVRTEQARPGRQSPALFSNGQSIEVSQLPATSNQVEPEKELPALPTYDRKLLLDLLAAQEGGATPSSAVYQVTGQKGGRKYQEAIRLLKLYQEGAINVDEKA